MSTGDEANKDVAKYLTTEPEASIEELQEELTRAREMTANALSQRDHSEAKLAEIEDILGFASERIEEAEVLAEGVGELEDRLGELEVELSSAKQKAEAAYKDLREYEVLANEAEERAYQAELYLWLAEQRLRDARAEQPTSLEVEAAIQGSNRTLIDRQTLALSLSHAVKQAGRHKRKLALLSIGLTGSKETAILQPILTKRLFKVVRDSDLLGRLSDDTFGLLVSEQVAAEDIRFIARCIARRVESVFADPVVVQDDSHFLRVAIGVSVYPEDAPTASLVLRHSEKALAEARLISLKGLHFYSQRP